MIKRLWLDKTAIGLDADNLIVRENIEFATRSSNLDVWPFRAKLARRTKSTCAGSWRNDDDKARRNPFSS